MSPSSANTGAILGSGPSYCVVRLDGPILSRLRSKLSTPPEEFPSVRDSAARVVEQLPAPEVAPADRERIARTGLILGRIQAGKTDAMITTAALALDSGYKLVIVLTSDNTWLYDQTLRRFKRSLVSSTVAGMAEWNEKKQLIATHLKASGAVLITTKNQKRLRALLTFLEELDCSDAPAIIFDDEADQASLDTNARNPDSPPSTVNQLIRDLRDQFWLSGFIQVTATPQALFLLDRHSPFRPEFIVVIEPGSGYIGGDVYFAENSPYLMPVSLNEIAYLKSPDPVIILPPGLRAALSTFFVGASSKLVDNDSNPYSLLIHVSLKKKEHERLRDLVLSYMNQLSEVLLGTYPTGTTILSDLQEAYDNLLQTADNLPPFQTVIATLRDLIASTDVQVLNSASSEKQARSDAPYNILIGGTKLGRGVTIRGLLVTYYGREARTPQMDTVQQHARMYGYRKKDLPITRIFLPDELAQYFRDINMSETELREWLSTVRQGPIEPQIIPTGMRATRRNVLNPATVGCYVPGHSYAPSLTAFLNYNDLELTEHLDAILGLPGRGSYDLRDISIDDALELLRLIKTDDSKVGRWDDTRIREALRMLKNAYENKATLVVFSHRRLSPTEKPNVADSADLRRAPRSYPALLMFRQEGLIKDGWPCNTPFWVPVVQFPEGRYPIAFNFS